MTEFPRGGPGHVEGGEGDGGDGPRAEGDLLEEGGGGAVARVVEAHLRKLRVV